MKFVCDKCHTRYSISDEKVKGKVLKIRCKTCGNIIVVREHGAESAAAVGAQAGGGPAPRTELELQHAAAGGGGGGGRPLAPSSPTVEWFVAIKGKQHGPMKRDQVAQLFREGKVHPRSYCWHEELPGWTRMRDLPDFQDVIAQGQSPAGASAPPPPPPEDEAGAEVVSLAAHRQQRAAESGVPSAAEPGPVTQDPFAAVGGVPAAGADQAPRESTRVFIMNAGLHNRSKKHRTYAIVATVLFAGLVGAGYLDYKGIIKIPILSDIALATAATLGDEKAQLKREKKRVAAAWADGEDVDPAAQCKFLGLNCPDDSSKRKRGPRKASNGDSLEDLDIGGTFDPNNPNLKRGDVGPDGKPLDLTASNADDAKRIAALLGGGREAGSLKVKDRKKDAKRDIALAGGSGLDAKAVSTVVNQNMGSLKTCIERAAKNGQSASGKQKLLLTVQPNGRVQKARIINGAVNASPLGECVSKAARKWKFPPFVGEATDIDVPLILTAQ